MQPPASEAETPRGYLTANCDRLASTHRSRGSAGSAGSRSVGGGGSGGAGEWPENEHLSSARATLADEHVGGATTAPPSLSRASTGNDRVVDSDEVEAAGRFRLYLGAAAGVGKTFAMLDEAHRRAGRGTDVVVGYVEAHRRPRTEERIEGLEIVPRKVVVYRGSRFEEMDVEAILARRPRLVLVDELAHTNVPGSGPHEKRWQDVMQLLEAGIDVISTVNIQHLESIADSVEQMTDTQVRERVPDRVVRKADQIELVDSSPEQLRRRMVHGNIYPAEKVPQALTHFFQTDNLFALRELALRFLADETEEELLEHLQRRHAGRLWETAERILVGVTAAPGTAGLVRRAARIASRSKAELDVVHIASGDAVSGHEEAIAALKELAIAVGARWHEVTSSDPARALIGFARENQITQIVIGASQRSRLQELLGGGSIARRVQRGAGAAGIDVHTIARREGPGHPQDEDIGTEAPE
jgi:two-component system, OmpR family, sensor histidine kinase KdpD